MVIRVAAKFLKHVVVQPYYTRLLAQACGLKVALAPEGDAVVVTAS